VTVQNYTLALIQGSTYSASGSVSQGGVAYNLTGYTIAGKIRRKFSDSAALQVLTVAITDAAGGLFSVSLTAAETAALTLASTASNVDERLQSIGVYDIEITSGATVIRIAQGAVTLSLEATKT
jgi:hypothetical protein